MTHILQTQYTLLVILMLSQNPIYSYLLKHFCDTILVLKYNKGVFYLVCSGSFTVWGFAQRFNHVIRGHFWCRPTVFIPVNEILVERR